MQNERTNLYKRKLALTSSGVWNSLIARSICWYKYAPPFENTCNTIGFASKFISYNSLTIFCPIGIMASRFHRIFSTGAVYRTVINLWLKYYILFIMNWNSLSAVKVQGCNWKLMIFCMPFISDVKWENFQMSRDRFNEFKVNGGAVKRLYLSRLNNSYILTNQVFQLALQHFV